MLIERCHPASFTRSPENADRLRELVRQACESAGARYQQRNYLRLRRGPYLIAAVLDESVDDQPLKLDGRYLDLLDPQLAIRSHISVASGQQVWLLDLDRVRGTRPMPLAAAGRIESWDVGENRLTYHDLLARKA